MPAVVRLKKLTEDSSKIAVPTTGGHPIARITHGKRCVVYVISPSPTLPDRCVAISGNTTVVGLFSRIKFLKTC